MGAGFSRMNSLTVVQTSQGLAEYLLKEHTPLPDSAGIVVGYDARHNSKKFAELAAMVFLAKGFRVFWYNAFVHTPMVPFGVNLLEAVAGVMITASHNPAQDNGYKVYGSNSCQINSPTDAHVAAAILSYLEPTTWQEQTESPRKELVLPFVKSQYIHSLAKYISLQFPTKLSNCPQFVYTPLHGVGLEYLTEALEKLGIFKLMATVEQQAEPNPDFPTLRYPNPEEKGALDLAIATADRNGLHLVLANDPDADRLAVAEKVGDKWQAFTGDQIGVLIASFLFENMDNRYHTNSFVLTTAVSSQMLAFMAQEQGFRFEETLTGFKWLGNRASDSYTKLGHGPVLFGYEEALGYMFPSVVLDKDGVLASIVFLSACAKWASPWAKLQELYHKYGYFQTVNTYWRSPDIATTAKIFAKVRSLGNPFPSALDNRDCLRWRDLTKGYDSGTKDNVPILPSSDNMQMITCWLSGTETDQGIRFTVRASGTEPKIKSKASQHQLVLQTVTIFFQYILSV